VKLLKKLKNVDKTIGHALLLSAGRQYFDQSEESITIGKIKLSLLKVKNIFHFFKFLFDVESVKNLIATNKKERRHHDQ